MKKFTISVITLLIAVHSFLSAEDRTWTQESTGRKIQGEFLKMQDDKTAVLKINGRETPIPVAMLVKEDQDFIAALNAPASEKMEETPGKKSAIPEGETVVTLSGVALHCSQCEENAEGAIKHEKYGLSNPENVTVEADRKAGTLKITAKTGKDAMLALNCINKLGFYGTSDHESVKIAENTKGDLETTTMVMRGVNLACGNCVRDVKKILKSVDGVEDFELKESPKGDSNFTVKGNFKPIDVIKALRENGYGGYYQ